jgi:hypothetical protein
VVMVLLLLLLLSLFVVVVVVDGESRLSVCLSVCLSAGIGGYARRGRCMQHRADVCSTGQMYAELVEVEDMQNFC